MLGGVHTDPGLGSFGHTRQLGKYTLLRRLATGGMAELYLARSSAIHGFEKLVVLKRILPQHAQSEDFIQMFLTEARLAATLHHPNIVQVYDIGEDRSTYFFTMEYVQGQDLRRLVRSARRANQSLPLEHILHIVTGVAAGLHHAHEKIGLDGRPLGIVHRDVSPSNVLVTYDGGVKIVDFGIAKAASAQTATMAGTLKGKIPYMSPEQCRGEDVDRRSDIFSIGTLLWELSTGVRLFTGDNEFAVLNRVAAGDVPSPRSIRADYPVGLEAIVMRTLQADPSNRYETAQQLQIALEDFIHGARLQVSSARMARFMRDLFEEEMQTSTVVLGPSPLVTASHDTPSLSAEAEPGPVADADADVMETTPSELRDQFASVGSVPDETRLIEESATDISLSQVRSGRRSVAVISGLLGAVAAVGVLGWLQLNPRSSDDREEPTTPPQTVIRPRIERVEAIGSSAEDRVPAPPSAPTREPSPPGDRGARPAQSKSDTVDPSGESEQSPDEDSSRRPAKRGSSRRKPSKPRSAKSPSNRTSTWDIDSPIPEL